MIHARFQAAAVPFVCAIAGAFLAACGGGGGEPPAGAPTVFASTSPSASPSASPTATPSPTPSPSPSPSQSAAPASCGLRPVFMEEFNDLSVSPSRIGPARWTAHTPWNGDFGDARFLDPGPDGPFKVSDGVLSITAKKDANGRWTSGLLAAADASGAGAGARYGYFETRMKLPPGPGLWPAFWLHSLKPAAGSDGDVELDVIEYYGAFTDIYHAVTHVWYHDSSRSRGQEMRVAVPAGSLVNAFHTYGVDISPQALTYFLDGVAVWTDTTPVELNTPMYPLINLALGGGGGLPIDQTPNPSVLLVDYVHVYGRDAGPPVGCQPGPPR